jgi:NAD(P)-dependent dehydrogenase (short-subunit alcohol dehydrogenase family)
MVKAYSTEFAGSGVRVNCIAPGWIETEMSRKALEGDPVRKAKVLGRTPMGALGLPEDIGWAAVYLASPAARYVTGVTLPVDGGTSIGF